MAQDFYTLEEAAKFLGISQDELKQLAKQGKLRSFQDRGTMRFRVDEVVKNFRERGGHSDPGLTLGEAPRPRTGDSPPPAKSKKGAEAFDFSLDTDDAVQIGQEIPSGSGSQRKLGSKSDSGKGPPSPAPKPGSDSDVRLVADGSDLEFQIASDSDVKIVDDAGPKSGPAGGPKSPQPGAPKSGPPANKPPSGVGRRKSGSHLDSGVRLVDLDSDSDVKIIGSDDSEVAIGRQPPKSAHDSDIRLEHDSAKSKPGKKSGHDPLLTEEIDLDAEIRKAEEAARAKHDSTVKVPPHKGKQPEFPTTSPFELSEADDVRVPPAAAPAAKAKKAKKEESSDDFDLAPGKAKDSSADIDLTPGSKDASSDFDLNPAADSSSPLELGSDEFQLEVGDESAVGLGDLPAAKGQSGINLKDPADSGISLEQGGDGSDEIEFELSLDAESTPKPAKQAKPAKPAPKSDADSDSEFELTIDETGGLAPLEEEPPSGEEKDIFETDFDVPALEEESGSEAMALDEADTDLDSSDFDIALSESDMSSEDESGSQVVALDDEEAEDGAKTVQRPRAKKKGTVLLDPDEESSSGLEEIMGDEPVEEEEEVEPVAVGAVAAAPAAEWGILPVVFLLPCVAILLLVGFLGFEMIQGVMGYQKPGMLTTQLSKMLNLTVK